MSYIDNPGAGGGAPTDASYVTGSAEASLSNELVLGSAVIMRGLLAARPAAGTAGRLYFITDASDQRWTRDTGAAWENAGPDWDFVTGKPATFAPVAHALGGADHNADTLANLNALVSDANLAAHAGDIGAGSPTAPVIPDETITFAKLEHMNEERIIGRQAGAGFGDPRPIAVLGGLIWTGANGIARGALVGEVTAGAQSDTLTIADNAVLFARMQNIATDRLMGRDSAGSGDPEEIAVSGNLEFDGAGAIRRAALTGEVTAPAGSGVQTIAANAVVFARMQDIATDRLIGRDTAATGDPEEIAVGGNLEFDGAGAIRRAALTGDVTAPAGSGVQTVAANAVTNAKLRDSAAVSVIGRGANSSGDPADLGAADGEFLRRVGSALAFGSILFSRGGTLLDPTGARNVIVWRAPIACTVPNVRGYRVGGSGATINARRGGSLNHLSSALSLTSADAWADGGAVQNTAYAAGDKMEIMIVSVTGTPTEIAILVDFTRP